MLQGNTQTKSVRTWRYKVIYRYFPERKISRVVKNVVFYETSFINYFGFRNRRYIKHLLTYLFLINRFFVINPVQCIAICYEKTLITNRFCSTSAEE